MSCLPFSWILTKASLSSSTQLPEVDVTGTVMDLPLSRLVTLSMVPTLNWLLDADTPCWPDVVTVEPLQTWLAAVPAAAPLPALVSVGAAVSVALGSAVSVAVGSQPALPLPMPPLLSVVVVGGALVSVPMPPLPIPLSLPMPLFMPPLSPMPMPPLLSVVVVGGAVVVSVPM